MFNFCQIFPNLVNLKNQPILRTKPFHELITVYQLEPRPYTLVLVECFDPLHDGLTRQELVWLSIPKLKELLSEIMEGYN